MVLAHILSCLKDDKDSRNFSIFYQMLAGITSEEKQLWSLNEKPDHFHYLNHSKQSSSLTSTDSEAFEQLRDNLKNLGIGRRQQSQVFQLLSAILHLGNITFVNDNTSNESCAIKNVAQLQTTADLLGIEPSALETVLTSRSRLVRRDLISEFLDADAAVEQRDSLARSLYAIASTWIVDQINKKLCKEDSEWKNFIAVLDMPGLAGADQQPELNDLHRLLVNYANTRLFSFVDQLFGNDVSTSSFEREGFGPFARLFSNSTVALQLLDPSVENATGNKKYNSYDNGGLLQILDDLCISASSSNGPVQEDVLNAITRECSSSSAFLSTASEAQSFSIRHHKGCIVEYSVEGLCKSNYDLVQDDFVGMVKGDGSGEMAGSINGFFRSLVKADKTVDSSQANGPTRVGDQVKRRPSMKGRRKGGDKKDRKPSVNTVSSLVRKDTT